MSRTVKYRLLGKALVLVFLSFCLWTFSSVAKPTQQGEQRMAVTAIQLQADQGITPVELRCTPGLLSAQNVLESFRCVLKNNTNKAITAADVSYSLTIEQNGSEAKTSYASTIDTRLHPDFASTSKPIGPGEESGNLGPPGPISFENAVIKGIEISIDYIELADGSTLGVDRQGSRIIRTMRGGAEKYKKWFRARYTQSGKSLTSIASLLYDQPLPSELQLSSADEEQGAKAYRKRLKKMYENKGSSEVEKYLKAQ